MFFVIVSIIAPWSLQMREYHMNRLKSLRLQLQTDFTKYNGIIKAWKVKIDRQEKEKSRYYAVTMKWIMGGGDRKY